MVNNKAIILLFLLLPLTAAMAQEVLSPLLSQPMRRTVSMTKAQPDAVTLPFFDDFATGSLDPALWRQQGGADVTFDVSPLAPTVGVLTLDALDGNGRLYSHASTNLFSADTATSLPLRLDSLSPADSVVLSFYYLPGGGYGNMWERVGYTPDMKDSLFLDFYSPRDSVWVNVWGRCGVSVDTLIARTGRDWQYVAVAISDSVFFDSTFSFRFRNHASLESTPKAGVAGNCDYWHIDYLMIDTARSVDVEPAVRDIAFAAPASNVLQYYRAMPYKQYRASDMAPSFKMKIVNRYSSELASQYTYSVLDSMGTELYPYDGGFENAPSFMPGGVYQTVAGHAEPPIGFSFPLMSAPTEYTVLHVVKEGAAGDDYGYNDTVRNVVRFGEYFAYDDGTAENGYNLTSTASTIKLAYRFDLNVADTLTAIDLFFNSTLDDANLSIPFYLTVWNMGADGKPEYVLYRDNTRRLPLVGGYHRYRLEWPIVLSGSVFVGFEQSGNDFINLGFDRSFNTADRIYYFTDNIWEQSFKSGSLMLRPCFGSAAIVGIVDMCLDECEVKVYPNPADERIVVEGEIKEARLYDMYGRQVTHTEGTFIDVRHSPAGVYLMRISMPDGAAVSKKVIIKH